jgi:hypothetical protein
MILGKFLIRINFLKLKIRDVSQILIFYRSAKNKQVTHITMD